MEELVYITTFTGETSKEYDIILNRFLEVMKFKSQDST